MQPGTSIIPVPVGGGQGNAEGFGGLLHRETREIAELYQICLPRIFLSQFLQSLIQRQQIVRNSRCFRIEEFDVFALAIAAAPQGFLAASVLDENAAHGFCRGSEKVAAAAEMLITNEPQVRFVHESRRLKCLPRFLVRQVPGGEAAQLFVHQGQQLDGSLGIALFVPIQNPRYLIHARNDTTVWRRHRQFLISRELLRAGFREHRADNRLAPKCCWGEMQSSPA